MERFWYTFMIIIFIVFTDLNTGSMGFNLTRFSLMSSSYSLTDPKDVGVTSSLEACGVICIQLNTSCLAFSYDIGQHICKVSNQSASLTTVAAVTTGQYIYSQFTELEITCPEGWVLNPIKQTCFFFQYTASITWSAAESKCEDLGAHLAILDSSNVFNWFVEVRTEHTAYSSKRLSVGASWNTAGYYSWKNGLPVSDEVWLSGQPSARKSGYCAFSLYESYNFHFADAPCSSYQSGYVCEKD